MITTLKVTYRCGLGGKVRSIAITLLDDGVAGTYSKCKSVTVFMYVRSQYNTTQQPPVEEVRYLINDAVELWFVFRFIDFHLKYVHREYTPWHS